MPGIQRFLIVDDNADSRFLLVKTLLRKFPKAVFLECHSGEAAIAVAIKENLAAIIGHRGYEQEGVNLIRRLRAASPDVPIIMVSGVDRSVEALAAGADAFLLYDEWLRVGTVVTELMAEKSKSRQNLSAPSAIPV